MHPSGQAKKRNRIVPARSREWISWIPGQAALALLAPATEGVADFLLRRALAEGDFWSFWFLGAMGPAAAAAIPDLERAIADPRTETEVHAYAATSLSRIRDSADREGLRRTQLFPMQ